MKTRSIAVGVLGMLIGVLVTVSIAATSGDQTPAAQAEFQLPPGWTEADMQACMIAGTPGEAHQELARGAGTWEGTTTMWMFPGAEPVTSASTSRAQMVMDGRYLKVEWSGEMPGMGPYSGLGFYGYDNVSQKYVATWIDNHSTGMMHGTGERSADGKVTTINYTYNCPITKKACVMRDVETITGPDTKTMQMYGTDPVSGKEFKMMQIDLKRN